MKTRFSAIVLASAFVLTLSSLAYAQVALPDYSKWESVSGTTKVVLNGNALELGVSEYQIKDEATLFEGVVDVLKNTDGSNWLLFYAYFQHTPDHQNEGKVQLHVYEWKDGGWSHVKDFSNSANPTQERDALLNSKYGLEFPAR